MVVMKSETKKRNWMMIFIDRRQALNQIGLKIFVARARNQIGLKTFVARA